MQSYFDVIKRKYTLTTLYLHVHINIKQVIDTTNTKKQTQNEVKALEI